MINFLYRNSDFYALCTEGYLYLACVEHTKAHFAREERLIQQYIQYWREWLQQHIGSMDFVTANFLSQLNVEFDLT